MVFRQRLIKIICEYFKISYQDYDTSLIQIYNEKDLIDQPMSREHGENYDLYNISSSFLLFFSEYTGKYCTNMIVNSPTRILSREITSSQHLSKLHRHQYFELVYVVEGQLDLMIESVHHRLSAHDACIINPNVRHVEEYTSDFSAVYLSMKPDFISSLQASQKQGSPKDKLVDFLKRNLTETEDIDYLNFTPVFQNNDESCKHIEELLFRFVDEMLFQEPGFMEICRQYMKRLFLYFQDPTLYLCSNTHFHQIQGQTVFERTVNYLYTNKRKITREELGQVLHYNGNYISHVFQKHTGQTLAEYNRNICLTEAANLLLNTELNISEIIRRLGFENKTAFYRQFEKKYGLTPNKYRHSRPE